jgi:hypothetical protein
MQEQLDRIEEKLDLLLEKTGKRKRITVIDAEFRTRMVEDYSVLGDQMAVDHQIDLALAHKTAEKYNDKQRYVINWLKNAVDYQTDRQPQSPGLMYVRDQIKAHLDRTKFDSDFETREAMRNHGN